MLKLCRITKLKVFFPVLVYGFNFDLFEFSAAILEKGLLRLKNLRNSVCFVLRYISVVNGNYNEVSI